MKRKEGTEALLGVGSYVPGIVESPWAYGLGGEVMLNFTPLAIPLGYGLLGLLVGRVRRFARSLTQHDIRVVLLPFLVGLCFFMLAWDSNNMIVYVVKTGGLPIFVLMMSSRRKTRTTFGRLVQNSTAIPYAPAPRFHHQTAPGPNYVRSNR